MSPTTADPRPTVRTSALRVRIEHASDPLLQRLSRLPSNTVVVVFLVLLVAGLAVRGWIGAVLIGLVALAHGWGAYLAWPRLSGLERQMRLAVLMLVVALAAVCLISALR